MTPGAKTGNFGESSGVLPQPLVILRSALHFGRPWAGYLLAIGFIGVTGALRLYIVTRLSDAPFLLFYPAIAAVSFVAGAGPGLMAMLLGASFAIAFLPVTPNLLSWIVLAVLGPLLAAGFAHLRYLRDQHYSAMTELASFKFIGDHASDWILLLHANGKIHYANHRACADLGWTQQELAGRHIETLVPEAQKRELKTLLDEVKSGSSRPIELTFERRDKTAAVLELACTAVRMQDDQIIYAAARDIAARKQIEQKLQEVRHWESLGVLAGGLAHDFNNLLTAILGYASLAKDSLPPGHDAVDMLDSIVSASERSADLVRMMLATAGYRPRYNEALELDRLLDWMLANRPLPPKVTVSRQAESTRFDGDRRSIDTLLWSLIVNAAESYRGEQEGTVRVTIRYGESPPVRSASFQEGETQPGEYLVIVVEDEGCGMPPDVLDRAFDPFFSTKFTGRGLGLPAVRGIVRAYSGRLLLDTASGKGTGVEVWLPVASKPPHQSPDQARTGASLTRVKED
jgi:PAS domain S-box-containing protein